MIILTHSGKAHRDELLAVALIMASGQGQDFVVLRREPTEEELLNPDIWVVDVGQKCEPALLNFDHHFKGANKCAFELVADHLGLAMEDLPPWAKTVGPLDLRGPKAIEEMFGISYDGFLGMQSPVEDCVKKLFEESETVSQELISLLTRIGKEIIRAAAAHKSGMLAIENGLHFAEAGKLKVSWHKLTEDGLPEFEYLRAKHPEVEIAISPDKRGGGFKATRLSWASETCFDFRSLKGKPGVGFIHPNGFMATFASGITPEEIIEMIKG